MRLREGFDFIGYENLKSFANSIFRIDSSYPHLAFDGRWGIEGFCEITGKFIGNLPCEWLELA